MWGKKTCPIISGRRYLFDTDTKLTMRQVILTPGEDGYWVAEVPSLPGCISQGKTKEESLTNIKEAIEGYIAALKDDGIPVPEEHFEVLVAVV
jgi:predicted RNase H-like HicB family nuclease